MLKGPVYRLWTSTDFTLTFFFPCHVNEYIAKFVVSEDY